MSYEGREEFICKNGHHWVVDALTDMYAETREHRTCTHCKKPAKFRCSIDDTNGFYEEEPATFAGPKTLIRNDDVPQVDHRGNKYFTLLPIFSPDLTSGRWITLKCSKK